MSHHDQEDAGDPTPASSVAVGTDESEPLLTGTAEAHGDASASVNAEPGDTVRDSSPSSSYSSYTSSSSSSSSSYSSYTSSSSSSSSSSYDSDDDDDEKGGDKSENNKTKDKGDTATLLDVVLCNTKGKGATVFSSSVNLSNAILGSGLLSLPFAIASVGLIPGLMFIVIFGGLAFLGAHLLMCTSRTLEELHRGKEFPEVTFYTVAVRIHPKLPYLVDLAVMISNGFSLTGYLIVISDMLPDIIKALWPSCPDFMDSYKFWQLMAILFIGPLCFFKKFDSFRFASIGAMVAVFYLVGLTIAMYFMAPAEVVREPIQLVAISTDVFSSMPIFIFAFGCCTNVFPVFYELRTRRYFKANFALTNAIFFTGVIYVIEGSFGYASVGPNVDSNVINSYPVDMLSVTFARIFMVFLVSFSYPLQVYPIRKCIDSTLFAGRKPDNWYPNVRHVLETFFWLILTFLFAFFFRELDIVLSLAGSLGSTLTTYLLPGVFYWFYHQKPYWHFRRIVALSIALFGVFGGLLCATFTLLNEYLFT
ncbi:vacuolar amino acid transporter 5 [Pelomyxa schiedti]|nr:vacuolar amino acid transporter 5 [Pelomyxa schiedti]